MWSFFDFFRLKRLFQIYAILILLKMLKLIEQHFDKRVSIYKVSSFKDFNYVIIVSKTFFS